MLGWNDNSWRPCCQVGKKNLFKAFFFSQRKYQQKPKRAFQLCHLAPPSEVAGYLCGSAGLILKPKRREMELVAHLQNISEHTGQISQHGAVVCAIKDSLIPDGKWISCLFSLSGKRLTCLMHTGDTKRCVTRFLFQRQEVLEQNRPYWRWDNVPIYIFFVVCGDSESLPCLFMEQIKINLLFAGIQWSK